LLVAKNLFPPPKTKHAQSSQEISQSTDHHGRRASYFPTLHRSTSFPRGRGRADAFADPSSPQSKAIQWIMHKDPLKLGITDGGFVQRYVIATLVFAALFLLTMERRC